MKPRATACRALIAAVLSLHLAAQAENAPVVIKPVLGIQFGFSNVGRDVGAVLGLRVSSFMVRGSARTNALLSPITSHAPGRAFDGYMVRGDWVFGLTKDFALYGGLGYASFRYGYLFDSPVEHVGSLVTQVGLIAGESRALGLGRAMIECAVLPNAPGDQLVRGDPIASPRIIVSLSLSL